MTFSASSRYAAIAVALTIGLAATSARADEEECEGVVKALNKRAEEIMKTDPKTPAPLCAGMGELVGMMVAAREIADKCYDEGKKRTDLIKDMADSAKTMREEIAKVCK